MNLSTIIFFFAFLGSSFICPASFHFSGTVHGNRQIKLTLNIPFVYGFERANEYEIVVDEQGGFRLDVPLKEQKFVYFSIDQKEYILLFKPHKVLHLNMNGNSRSIEKFHGSAAPENEVLHKICINKIPFFMERDKQVYTYAKTSPLHVQDQVVSPWFKIRDERIELIEKSKLSNADKALLKNEVYYNTISYLNDFVTAIVRWEQPAWSNFIMNLFDSVSVAPPTDSRGTQYYLFIDKYIRYLQTKAMDQYSKDTSMKTLPFFNISLDSGRRLAEERSEIYLSWMAVHQNLDKNAAENYLAQQIANLYNRKDLKPLTFLMDAFEKNYPASDYLSVLKRYSNELHTKLASNLQNESIEIYDGYDTVKSIYDVIVSMKGKVVYLDIWGTWCGPCQEELRYVQKLKERYQNQDIAFVYLDLDDEKKDKEWRDFIRVNELEGIHLRMNNDQIQSVWQELLPDDKKLHGLYPTYFIFDRQGNLSKEKAKRPSDQDVLYKQLDKYLR